jgi:HK97 family phage prohead protease
MATKVEYRQLPNTVRASRSSKSDPEISGYASLFSQPIVLNGYFEDFTEVVLPGAFSKTIAEGDCRCLWNHEPNFLLGRVSAGTLSLHEDGRGLFFRCKMPDTQWGRDVLTSVERKDCQGASIGFQVVKQNWIDEKQADGSTKTTRELAEVELFDAGPVAFPAAEKTTVEAVRSMLWPSGVPDEVRMRTDRRSVSPEAIAAMQRKVRSIMASLDSGPGPEQRENGNLCECDCADCRATNCQLCTNEDCEDEDCLNCPFQQEGRMRAEGRTLYPSGTTIPELLAKRAEQDRFLRDWRERCRVGRS